MGQLLFRFHIMRQVVLFCLYFSPHNCYCEALPVAELQPRHDGNMRNNTPSLSSGIHPAITTAVVEAQRQYGPDVRFRSPGALINLAIY